MSPRRQTATRNDKNKNEVDNMRRKLTWVMLLIGAIMVTPRYVRPVLATPAVGFVGTTLALGRFGEIKAFNHIVPPEFWKSKHQRDLWLSLQRTEGSSDVYVQSNVWAPGGEHRLAHASWT